MRVLAVVLSVALLAPVAWAEDPAPPAPAPDAPAAEPAPKFPFGIEHLAPLANVVPEGWTKAEGAAPADAPTQEALVAIAKAAGVPENAIQVRVLMLKKGEGEAAKTAVAAWVGVNVRSEETATKVHDGIEEKGWLLKQVGLPHRALVTWAAEEDDIRAVQAWQTEKAVDSLCSKGWSTIETAAQDFDQTTRAQKVQLGQMLIGASLQASPSAGLPNAMVGAMLIQQNPQQALVHNRKALAKDATAPFATGQWAVQAAYFGGQALLVMEAEQKNKAMVEEARDILLKGVAAEQSAPNPLMRFGNRYNLGCAYARLDDLDKAFEHTEESLRYLKKAWEADKKKSFSGMSQLGYPQHFEHCKLIDTDMEPLRKDARWAPMIAKYDPDPKPAEADKKPEEKKPEESKPDGGDK